MALLPSRPGTNFWDLCETRLVWSKHMGFPHDFLGFHSSTLRISICKMSLRARKTRASEVGYFSPGACSGFACWHMGTSIKQPATVDHLLDPPIQPGPPRRQFPMGKSSSNSLTFGVPHEFSTAPRPLAKRSSGHTCLVRAEQIADQVADETLLGGSVNGVTNKTWMYDPLKWGKQHAWGCYQ